MPVYTLPGSSVGFAEIAGLFWLFTLLTCWATALINRKLGSLALVLSWWVLGSSVLFDLLLLGAESTIQTKTCTVGLVLGGILGLQCGLQQHRAARAGLSDEPDPTQGFQLLSQSKRFR